MTKTGLILAAHGSTTEPIVNRQVETLVGQIAERGLFGAVRCAFHRGIPPFSEAVDQIDADEIVVVPLMASDGYYATAVLPAALASAERFGDVAIRQTHAVGAHPRIPEIVSTRCRAVMAQFNCEPQATTVLLVGHGTPRHRDSRETTRRCVEYLTSRGVAAEVLPAFIEDQPSIEAAMTHAAHPNVVVIPFMIGFGRHVTKDIARRIGLAAVEESQLPTVSQLSVSALSGRRVVLDKPVGVDPEIEALIIDLALHDVSAGRASHALP